MSFGPMGAVPGKDVIPYALDEVAGTMTVLARMGLNNYEWPKLLHVNNCDYQYVCNEIMDHELGMRFSGYASYKKIN